MKTCQQCNRTAHYQLVDETELDQHIHILCRSHFDKELISIIIGAQPVVVEYDGHADLLDIYIIERYKTGVLDNVHKG